jgi:hypothetical protein
MAEFTPDLSLDEGEWSASHFGRFIPQGGRPARWMTDKILDVFGTRKIP